jgi:hypothetical protein
LLACLTTCCRLFNMFATMSQLQRNDMLMAIILFNYADLTEPPLQVRALAIARCCLWS